MCSHCTVVFMDLRGPEHGIEMSSLLFVSRPRMTTSGGQSERHRRRGKRVLDVSESFEPPLYLQPYGTILPSLRQRSGFRPTAQNTPHVCTYGTVVYVGPGGVAPGLEMSSMRFVPETRIKDIWWCSEQYHRHGRRVLGVSEYFEPPRVFAALWYHLSVLPGFQVFVRRYRLRHTCPHTTPSSLWNLRFPHMG